MNGGYFWNEGYWGPTVGFYGGINYGFGYFGMGFGGGRWDGGHFFYNRAVMNINVTEIHNVYNTTIDVHNDNHVSYGNGGNGGVVARPTPQEEAGSSRSARAPGSRPDGSTQARRAIEPATAGIGPTPREPSDCSDGTARRFLSTR